MLVNTAISHLVDRGGLSKHIKTHTGGKPYACKHCGKSFTTHYHLTYHIRTQTGEKPYACEQCGKSYTTQQSLNDHIRTHTGQKPYACVVASEAKRSYKNDKIFLNNWITDHHKLQLIYFYKSWARPGPGGGRSKSFVAELLRDGWEFPNTILQEGFRYIEDDLCQFS